MFSRTGLKGRSENSIKNRFHSLSKGRKVKRAGPKNQEYTGSETQNMDEIDYEIVRLFIKLFPMFI